MKHIINIYENIYEAKTHLSRLVDEAERGEDIVIARAGKPVARLIRIEPKTRKRPLGLLDGQFSVPDDFNAPLPDEILAAFEGRAPLPSPQPSPRGRGSKR